MTQQEKDLLLKDLCARLSYGVKIHVVGDWFYDEQEPYDTTLCYNILNTFDRQNYGDRSLIIKPYLRPMSSMTEEEAEELDEMNLCNHTIGFYNRFGEEPHFFTDNKVITVIDTLEYIDWLNSHHFDYRGLIEKGLALEAPEGMYKI